jgi:hypothetical protein
MKFMLRDLLWLTLVLCVAFSWLHSSRKQRNEYQSIIDTHNKVQEAWKAETAETIERYRQAALDPAAYQKALPIRDQEMSPEQLERHFEEARTRALLYSLRPEQQFRSVNSPAHKASE